MRSTVQYEAVHGNRRARHAHFAEPRRRTVEHHLKQVRAVLLVEVKLRKRRRHRAVGVVEVVRAAVEAGVKRLGRPVEASRDVEVRELERRLGQQGGGGLEVDGVLAVLRYPERIRRVGRLAVGHLPDGVRAVEPDRRPRRVRQLDLQRLRIRVFALRELDLHRVAGGRRYRALVCEVGERRAGDHDNHRH